VSETKKVSCFSFWLDLSALVYIIHFTLFVEQRWSAAQEIIWGTGMQPSEAEATRAMEEANRIIEDFPTQKYLLYATIFTIEIILCFWLALKLL
jgi:hypothetical protein